MKSSFAEKAAYSHIVKQKEFVYLKFLKVFLLMKQNLHSWLYLG